jgi:hypothetical protein
MDSLTISPHPCRMRRLRLIFSMLVIGLVAATALVVPHVIHAAHAASPTHATSSCAQPPIGKDPTTFTNQQLKTYGLPSYLPGLSQAKWAKIVHHAKHRFCLPPTMPAPAVQHGLMRPQHATGVEPNIDNICCYAGLEGDDASGFISVDSSWVIPCTSGAPNSTTYSWIGLGSYSTNGPYLRVGVVMHQVYFTIPTPYGPIVENYPIYSSYLQATGDPNNPGAQSVFDVACGDMVFGDVYTLAPSQYWVFFVDDASGNYIDVTEDASVDTTGASCLVGNDIDGSHNLFDFGTLTFTDCEGIVNDDSGVVKGLFALPNHWSPTLQDCGDGSGHHYVYVEDYHTYSIFPTPAEVNGSTFTITELSPWC